jgi:hypothetical protein
MSKYVIFVYGCCLPAAKENASTFNTKSRAALGQSNVLYNEQKDLFPLEVKRTERKSNNSPEPGTDNRNVSHPPHYKISWLCSEEKNNAP